MYVPDSYIIAHTLEDTLAPDGSHVLVFNWAWLFLAAMLHFVLVMTMFITQLDKIPFSGCILFLNLTRIFMVNNIF